MVAKMDTTLEKTNASYKKMMARMDAWLTDVKDIREKAMSCQEQTEARLEKKKNLPQWSWNLRWIMKKFLRKTLQ
jgi:hypothetical protein